MTDRPTQVTDLRRRAPLARSCIKAALNELIGEVDLHYDFYREWNGCWRVRVTVSGAASGELDFVLMHTPGGGMLALPRPLPEPWRTGRGILASDGTRWTLSDDGDLVPYKRDG